MIISFSRRLLAIWLNDSVSVPSSSREVTGSATWKLPAAMARVPSTNREIGRESSMASPAKLLAALYQPTSSSVVMNSSMETSRRDPSETAMVLT